MLIQNWNLISYFKIDLKPPTFILWSCTGGSCISSRTFGMLGEDLGLGSLEEGGHEAVVRPGH